MALRVYSLEQSEQWDSIVRSFADHDVYWLSGYVRAFQIHGDGEPLLFYYEDGNVRGINAVMKRDVANDPHLAGKVEKGMFFDFATPYGYGGWLIEGDRTAPLFETYAKWCVENNIVSEFVRFHPMMRNHAACEAFYDVIRLGEVVHMELTSPAAVLENMSGKNRNVIRKAIKNDVKIYNGRYPEIYRIFRDIYNATMDKDNAKDYYYFGDAFYDSLLNDLPFNAQVFYAEKDGRVIAASIILTANGRMNYHLSGSVREFSTFAPTNLLLYEAARWGCANGYKTLYLGGGVGSGEDSLFKFKRAFYKGELNRFHIGRLIFDKQKYAELAAIRGHVDSSFFPIYRA